MLVWERERERDERREKMRKIVDIDRNRDRNRDRDDNQETWTFKILYYTFGWFVVWVANHKKGDVVIGLTLLFSLLLMHPISLFAGIFGWLFATFCIMIGLYVFKEWVDNIKIIALEEEERIQKKIRRGDIVYDFNDLIIVNDLSELRNNEQ